MAIVGFSREPVTSKIVGDDVVILGERVDVLLSPVLRIGCPAVCEYDPLALAAFGII